MEYVSIDIETTGIDHENNQILEIGAIVEDTEKIEPFDRLYKFHAIVRHDNYYGSAYAINLNQRIFNILSVRETCRNDDEINEYDQKHNIVHVNDIVHKFYCWLLDCTNHNLNINDQIKIIPAGKNFATFDKLFLEKLPDFKKNIKFAHRTIDPATLYCDFLSDNQLPSSEECLKRAGYKPIVSHNALKDAWDVIKILRKKY